jgi:hypothetical protein
MSLRMRAEDVIAHARDAEPSSWWDIHASPITAEESTGPDPDDVLFEVGLIIGVPLLFALILELAARFSGAG